jgi:hypothetical protein
MPTEIVMKCDPRPDGNQSAIRDLDNHRPSPTIAPSVEKRSRTAGAMAEQLRRALGWLSDGMDDMDFMGGMDRDRNHDTDYVHTVHIVH